MTAATPDHVTDPATVAWHDGALVITRVFGAPRELVFSAWTQPEHFGRWFGPMGSTMPVLRMDARPGGGLHFQHQHQDYPDVWVAGEFTEVAPPERLAFTCWFSGPDGGREPRPGFPGEMTIAVAFDAVAEGTRVTVRQRGLERDQGEVQGWRAGLDRLATLLARG